jgi:HEAT repeat protein
MVLQPNGNQHGGDGKFDRILADLHSPEDEVHHDAYDALIELGGEVVPVLVEAFPDTEGRARLSVIRAFGDLGDARAVALLVDLVRNRDLSEYMFVSSLAAKALGQLGTLGSPTSEQAIAGLIETLADENVGSRRMSALVLGNIADPEAVPALTAALADNDKQVRALAARALGVIGAKGKDADRAVPALTVRLADHDQLAKPLPLSEESQAQKVSDAAEWALRQIDSPDAKRALSQRGR